MAEPHRMDGHERRSEAERIAHLAGGRLADGIAIEFTAPQRVGIGRFSLRGLPKILGGPGSVDIAAEARPVSDEGIVWLTRISPGPRRTLGYARWAHAPGAHYHSYAPDLPEAAEAALCEYAAVLWAAAERRGEVSSRRPPGLVRLELTVIEGLRVDLTWETCGDAVALAFRDLEPEHLGTVTGLDGGTERGGDGPKLYPTPTHMGWATEPGRPERLIEAAATAYRRRPEPPRI